MTTSPHYSLSNGFTESQVKSVKAALLKVKTTYRDPYMTFLCLRATPTDHKLPSLAERLLGRVIQDNLGRKIPRDAFQEVVTPRLKERYELQNSTLTGLQGNFLNYHRDKE